MKAPPMIIRLRMNKKGSRGLRLCLPLLLIYIPLLLLAIILLPLVLIAAILMLPWGGMRFLLLYPRFYALLCALKELEIDVADNNQCFYISLK